MNEATATIVMTVAGSVLAISALITIGAAGELGRYERWYWSVISVIMPGAGPLAWFLRLAQLRHRRKAIR
jgi:hypothetical protein